MKPETRKALEESIEHWERLASGNTRPGEGIGPEDCALCGRFKSDATLGCEHDGELCPVAAATGKNYCRNTPHANVINCSRYRNAETKEMRSIFTAAAQAELDFLKSLRPLFNSKKEFALAMMDGRVFEPKDRGGVRIYYDEKSSDNPFRIRYPGMANHAPLSGSWDEYANVEEVTPPPRALKPAHIDSALEATAKFGDSYRKIYMPPEEDEERELIRYLRAFNEQHPWRAMKPTFSGGPLKWYDNIPEGGVYCWVKNFHYGEDTIKKIIERLPETHAFAGEFKAEGGRIWKYATPVTKADK
jgi:hypothetical protein